MVNYSMNYISTDIYALRKNYSLLLIFTTSATKSAFKNLRICSILSRLFYTRKVSGKCRMKFSTVSYTRIFLAQFQILPSRGRVSYKRILFFLHFQFIFHNMEQPIKMAGNRLSNEFQMYK